MAYYADFAFAPQFARFVLIYRSFHEVAMHLAVSFHIRLQYCHRLQFTGTYGKLRSIMVWRTSSSLSEFFHYMSQRDKRRNTNATSTSFTELSKPVKTRNSSPSLRCATTTRHQLRYFIMMNALRPMLSSTTKRSLLQQPVKSLARSNSRFITSSSSAPLKSASTGRRDTVYVIAAFATVTALFSTIASSVHLRLDSAPIGKKILVGGDGEEESKFLFATGGKDIRGWKGPVFSRDEVTAVFVIGGPLVRDFFLRSTFASLEAFLVRANPISSAASTRSCA
jgi:hypothetical protein